MAWYVNMHRYRIGAWQHPSRRRGRLGMPQQAGPQPLGGLLLLQARTSQAHSLCAACPASAALACDTIGGGGFCRPGAGCLAMSTAAHAHAAVLRFRIFPENGRCSAHQDGTTGTPGATSQTNRNKERPPSQSKTPIQPKVSTPSSLTFMAPCSRGCIVESGSTLQEKALPLRFVNGDLCRSFASGALKIGIIPHRLKST